MSRWKVFLWKASQGNFILSTQEMILRFTSQVSVDAEQWTNQLIDCPADLETIERTVHRAYARGADLLVAGLIAATISDGKILESAERTRQQFSRPLQKGRERPVTVQLLGGMIVWAVTLYSAPGRNDFAKMMRHELGWISRCLSSGSARRYRQVCRVEWRLRLHCVNRRR